MWLNSLVSGMQNTASNYGIGNGKNEDPLYTYLKSKKGGLFSSRIKWNFTKFLVGKDGTVINRFGPAETPESIEAFVKKALA